MMKCRLLLLVSLGALGLAGCGSGNAGNTSKNACMAAPKVAAVAPASTFRTGTSLTLMTHDSFALSDGVLESFTKQTGVAVKLVKAQDAGSMVSQAVLTSGKPTADVMFGVDNTFMCKALAADVFVPMKSAAAGSVAAELKLDPHGRLIPIDYGDVCINYWKDSFSSTKPPASLDDLTKPEFAGQFVTQHVDTSSPGFAFLLATIAKYGDAGWESFWTKLRANKVEVVAGWTEAYTEKFKAGGGDKAIVTSYATSPVAEVVFAKTPPAAAPTGVLTDACFRQVEFAGVLRGSAHPEAAAALVDFLLSEAVQGDIPLNMFVFPANPLAKVPADFTKHAVAVANPLTLDPAIIEQNRARWTERWTRIVTR